MTVMTRFNSFVLNLLSKSGALKAITIYFLSGGLDTPPIAEILCVKNVGAFVVSGFIIKKSEEIYAENMKKNRGSRLEVSCQSIPFLPKLGWIGCAI